MLAAMPAEARHPGPLVDVEWVEARLGDLDVVLLDIRNAIDGGSRAAFAEGHIPGAVHSDYLEGGWRRTVDGVPGQTPPAPELEALIGGLGIDNESTVLVIPTGVGASDLGGGALLDARPRAQFEGAAKHDAAKASGHLPGARHLDQATTFNDARGGLKDPGELEGLLASVLGEGGGEVVSYCNTGHWASVNWFVLSEVLGRERVRLYDGSMVGWTADTSRPVAR